MVRTVKLWQHCVVGVVILVIAVLAGTRIIGAGDDALFRPEHFDAKQVTVQPSGDDGVRLREVVDIDFGPSERRGYQRIVPHDFGVPIDIVASSPDANADVAAIDIGDETRIRIGHPNITFTGRHRYILEYTLPYAELASGRLALDIIGTDETFETDRFEVVLTGFQFTGTACDTGASGAFGGCELVSDDAGNHVAVIEPLVPGAGITVGGTFTGLSEPNPPPVPEPVPPVPSGFRPLGILMIPLGLLGAGGIFVWGRWYGSNEVVAGGAAEAAFGDLPAPRAGASVSDLPTYRVPDSRLAELATIEFVPPRGLEPWQGAMLLRENVGDHTVSAWFSEMVARDAIVIVEEGKLVRLSPGPETARLSAVDQGHLHRIFASRDSVELGKYDAAFTSAWNAIEKEQTAFAKTAGWWSRGGPGGAAATPAGVAGVVITALIVVGVLTFVALPGSAGGWGLLASPWGAVGAGIVIPLLVALVVYSSSYPARTATGSALTLRTESFRRFLEASEGRHVDWAWKQGLVREYSAWAVALGAAGAWRRAIETSNIPDPRVELGGPLLVHTASRAFTSSHTPPSSSGSSGGGGGGVGGGGGGGRSGSW
jgi:hypothetical protein